MKLTKKQLSEIIDSDGDLIGIEDAPTNGSNLDTQASHTTDHNLNIGNQPFTFNSLSRFGFMMMPFYEGKNDEQSQTQITADLYDIIFGRFSEILKYYYKNPNLLKSDYRKLDDKNDDIQKEENLKVVEKIINLINNYTDKSTENIDESQVVEDTMIDKKSEDEISKRSEASEIKEKNIEKIAGLINKKLSKKDVSKLITLIEMK